MCMWLLFQKMIFQVRLFLAVPEELKNQELLFWLKCRGDNGKGLKTKAQLVKRYGLAMVKIDKL